MKSDPKYSSLRNPTKVSPISTGSAALLLLVFQSCGIRFFSGQGSLLSLVIILLSLNGIRKIDKKDALILSLLAIFLMVNKLVNPQFEFSKLIYQFVLIFQTYVFLLSYSKKDQLLKDFEFVLKIIFLHASLGYLLCLLFPDFFEPVKHQIDYRALLNILYVSNMAGSIRNTGIAWEPGVLQLLLNLYLFICITNKKNWKWLIAVSIAILSTFSTAGFLILFLNYVYYLLLSLKSGKNILPLVLTSLLALAATTIVINNVTDKINGQNTSGLIRYRDYLIATELISEKPILGHGNFDSHYLLTKSYVSQIELNIFSDSYLNSSGDLSGGYTNGLLGLLCWYGLPMGLVCYFMSYRNKIINGSVLSRTIFFLILAISLLSEPITYTSFFLIFPFSYFIFKTNRKQIVIKQQYQWI